MNRTNSVEPVFSQPLQVTYHQLLQNKSKIEDELYQTQRQLRRKEGEYSKKIAVYEQKIDQMQEQIDDFREREENMKSMYEKILNALNNADDNNKMFPNIDLERVQEMLLQIQKSQQNSPTHSEKSMNSSFRRGFGGRASKQDAEFQREKEKYINQIDNLEVNLAKLTESNIKLKNQLSSKEKENFSQLNDIESLKRSLEITKKEVELVKQSNQNDLDTIISKTEAKVKNELCQQIDNYQSEFMIERARLVQENEKLEKQIQQMNAQFQQKSHQQERVYIKELSEIKQANEQYRQDIDKLSSEKETLVKEKDLLFQQVKEQNQNLTKIKSQQNNQSTLNSNEQVKRLKQRVSELEKELNGKQEEIQKLNSKVQTNQKIVQQQNTSVFTEGKNSRGGSVSQSLSNFSQIKNYNVGSKDQQILVDIQTTQVKKKAQNNNGSKTNRQPPNSNQNSQGTKMFPQQVTINIDNNQNLPTIIESTRNQKRTTANPKTSRNSNGIAHSSLANPQTFMPRHEQDKVRTHTPLQERHFVDLDESQSQNTSQILSSNHKKNMLDSSLNSGAKSNQNFHRYINANEVRNFDNMMSRSNSQSYYPEHSKRFLNMAQRSPQERAQFITQRQASEAPTDKYHYDSEKIFLSSFEIENVVRKMLEQVNYERGYGDQAAQSILKPSQFHNMQTPSQNVSFTLKKNLEHSQFNSSKYSSQNSKGQFTIDREFLIKLENSLKKLAKSNEKIKQIMKEKESFEQLCQKLRLKVKALKEEKNNWLMERENLIQANHKMECKLKQAQVILNLESEMQNQPSYLQNNNTGLYDVSHNSSQKTLIRHFGQRDISPGAQSNLTLNIIQDTVNNNERYKNPPMSCRVNDSYDVSLRLNPDNSYGALTRKPMFHNTLDRSLLDQSLITIKRDLMNQNYQNNSNLQISQMSNNNQVIQNQSYQSKFLPASTNIQLFPAQPQLVTQNSSNSTFRGKAPTLQINLSQTPNNETYTIGISTQNNQQQDSQGNISNGHYVSSSQERDDQSSIMNSMNLSKSTSNLANKKLGGTGGYQVQQPPRQLFKYQSNRSPQARAFQNYQHSQIQSGQNTIQKPNDLNSSNIAFWGQNEQSQLSQFIQNKAQQLNISSNTTISNINNSKQINSTQNVNQTQTGSFLLNQQNNNDQQQQQHTQGLRRLNSNKAKDRYYSNKRGSQQVQSVGRNNGDKYRYITHQTEISAVYPTNKDNHMLTFDEDEDYLIEEQQTLEDDSQQNTMSGMSMTMGRKNNLNQRATANQQQQPQNKIYTTLDNHKLTSTQHSNNNDGDYHMINNGKQNFMLQYQQQQQYYDAMFSDHQVNLQIHGQEDEEDGNMIDTDENESVNCFGQLTTKTNKSDSTINSQNIRRPPINRLSTCSIDNRQMKNQTQKHQQKIQDGVIIPSDERSSDEESVQYKMLNNSNFVPFMHSRYINEETQ